MPRSTPTPKKKRFTDHEKRVLAGVFARSNMGMGYPPVKDVRDALDDINKPWYGSGTRPVDDYAITFCQEFMENDEHERIFREEAAGWYKQLNKRGSDTHEQLVRKYPQLYQCVFGQRVQA